MSGYNDICVARSSAKLYGYLLLKGPDQHERTLAWGHSSFIERLSFSYCYICFALLALQPYTLTADANYLSSASAMIAWGYLTLGWAYCRWRPWYPLSVTILGTMVHLHPLRFDLNITVLWALLGVPALIAGPHILMSLVNKFTPDGGWSR